VENDIDPKEVRMATIMTNSLLEQLQLCSLTCSPQNLFAHPPSSLKTFCPHLVTDEKRTPQDNGKKRPHEEKVKDHSPNKKHKGCIVNTTGKRIQFPKGLTNKYCSEFLNNGTSCRHGDNCNFSHAIFPHGFAKEDIKPFEEYISKTEGYEFTSNHKPQKKVS
jgi:hypothetical protein